MVDELRAVLRSIRDGVDVLGAWSAATEREIRAQPFQRDVEFLRALLPWMEVMARYFDAEVEGLEHVPKRGPVLLVGNHSGGVLTPDTTALLAGWYRHFGLERPLIGLAFDAAFGIPGFRTLMRKIGEIPASHKNAAKALAQGLPVLVYPGGDHEVFRPWTERNRIDFNGRTGFVELALRARVPVVPVVSHGGHNSTVILTRGEWIGRWFGVERVRARGFPLALQFPWGFSTVGLPGVPLPAKITVRVLPPMRWSAHPRRAADNPAIVGRCFEEITGVMQATLTSLAEQRPYPLLSRLASINPFGARAAAPVTRRRPTRRRAQAARQRTGVRWSD